LASQLYSLGCGKTESPGTTGKPDPAANKAEDKHATSEKPDAHEGKDKTLPARRPARTVAETDTARWSR